MKLLDRLRELEAKIYAADAHEADKYHVQFLDELEDAWPLLREVVEAAKDVEPYLEEDHALVSALAALEAE